MAQLINEDRPKNAEQLVKLIGDLINDAMIGEEALNNCGQIIDTIMDKNILKSQRVEESTADDVDANEDGDVD